MLDENLKNEDGENRIEVRKRMEEVINEIIKKHKDNNIAIISHGGSIKFFLMKWCNFDENYNLVYNNKILEINSPSIIKLTFKENELVNICQIY